MVLLCALTTTTNEKLTTQMSSKAAAKKARIEAKKAAGRRLVFQMLETFPNLDVFFFFFIYVKIIISLYTLIFCFPVIKPNHLIVYRLILS